MRAGDAAGCARVEELTLEAPLAAARRRRGPDPGQPSGGPRRGRRARGRCTPARPRQPRSGPWTRHATRRAGSRRRRPRAGPGWRAWPPAATRPRRSPVYGPGCGEPEYGPAFRGLRAAWRRGGEVFAEVALPEQVAGSAGRVRAAPGPARRRAARGLRPARASLAPAGQRVAAVRLVRGIAARGRRRRRCGSGCAAAGGAVSPGRGRRRRRPVVSVESLVLRPVSAQLDACPGRLRRRAVHRGMGPARCRVRRPAAGGPVWR